MRRGYPAGLSSGEGEASWSRLPDHRQHEAHRAPWGGTPMSALDEQEALLRETFAD
jgi:hypothetical protein